MVLEFLRDAEGYYFRYAFYRLSLPVISWPTIRFSKYVVGNCINRIIVVCDGHGTGQISRVIDLSISRII